MKFFLITILTLADGSVYKEKKEVYSYDQCYYEGIKAVRKMESFNDDRIVKYELECVAGVDV